jgi:hypothetical protein
MSTRGGPRLAASDWAITVANAVQFPWFSMVTGHGQPSLPDPDLEPLREVHLPPA